MEMDTGAAVSIILEETHRNLFLEGCLQRGPLLLRTYAGESMVVVGQMDVQVNYASNLFILPLMMVVS